MRWLRTGEAAPSGRMCRLIVAVLTALVLAVQLTVDRQGEVPWRNFWFDTLQSQMPRDRGPAISSGAVIVAIDEESMSGFFEWPWPRAETARVIARMRELGAAAIAPDMILSQPDPKSHTQLAEYYRLGGAPEVAEVLEKLGDGDQFFEDNMHGAAVVLPVLGENVFGATDTTMCEFQAPAVLIDPQQSTEDLALRFPDSDPPLPIFQQAAEGLATINFDSAHGLTVRSVHAVQTICDSPFLLLGAEALRVANGGFLSHVHGNRFGFDVYLGDTPGPETLSFPVETDGTFWLHYGAVDAARYIPVRDLFEPDFDPRRIAGKVAILAVLDLGRIDERRSSLGQIIYGAEVHLQVIEQILTQDFLRRPAGFVWFELIVFVLGCTALAVFVPRAPSVQAVVAIGAGLGGLLALGAVLFAVGVLVDAISPAGGLLIVSLGAIAATLVERDRERLRSLADRAQLQGELDAAARIQTALLPPRRFQRAGEIDLASYIDPARTVGGDFYDHYMIDDEHLFFMVADVSGKGADASQFMLLSKTLWKSVALREGAPLDGIQLIANAEITRENTALMFVTGLCGLYNLKTRQLTYSSAGHDAPFLFGDKRRPEQIDVVSGPPAGLMDGAEFPVSRVQLAPGDRLCIFTDGVTEAMDEESELFGLARLEAALGSAPGGLDSAAMLDHLVASVRRFRGKAEPSDDLTVMVISILG